MQPDVQAIFHAPSISISYLVIDPEIRKAAEPLSTKA